MNVQPIERILRKVPSSWTSSDVVALLQAPDDFHRLICSMADQAARNRHGSRVTYVVNRNLNFSNACTVGCRFCAFFRPPNHKDVVRMSVPEAVEAVRTTPWVSEVCIQGGIDPCLNLNYYKELLGSLKAWKPSVHLHAFSPQEIVSLANRNDMTVLNVLDELKSAGLDSIPGTAAEILDDSVRHKISPLRLSTEEWKTVMHCAKVLGIRSSATMMFGHVENAGEIANHLLLIRGIQEKTGIFTEFVPMPFIPENTALKRSGLVMLPATQSMYERLIAVSRLLLDDVIANIQVSWVKAGMVAAAACLRAGANDLGGTLHGENITRMAGGEHGETKTPADFQQAAQSVGLTAFERTTLYDGMKNLNLN